MKVFIPTRHMHAGCVSAEKLVVVDVLCVTLFKIHEYGVCLCVVCLCATRVSIWPTVVSEFTTVPYHTQHTRVCTHTHARVCACGYVCVCVSVKFSVSIRCAVSSPEKVSR